MMYKLPMLLQLFSKEWWEERGGPTPLLLHPVFRNNIYAHIQYIYIQILAYSTKQSLFIVLILVPPIILVFTLSFQS